MVTTILEGLASLAALQKSPEAKKFSYVLDPEGAQALLTFIAGLKK